MQPVPPCTCAVASLLTYDLLIRATQLPNLPPNVPDQYANIDPTGDLGELGPAPDLAPDQILPPSDCPIMACKTRVSTLCGQVPPSLRRVPFPRWRVYHVLPGRVASSLRLRPRPAA